MARKRFTKRNRRRNRRKFTKRTRNGFSLGKSPLPTIYKANFMYSENISVNPAAGVTPALQVMRTHSLFDPNLTGTGHQPRGYDEMMTLYAHYTVVGVKCSVTFVNQSNGTGQNALCGITLARSAAILGDVNDYQENNQTKSVILGVSNGPKAPTITFNTNPNKFLGISNPMGNSTVRGSVSSSPQEDAYFHIWVAPTDGNEDLDGVDLIIRMEYIAILTERKAIAQS